MEDQVTLWGISAFSKAYTISSTNSKAGQKDASILSDLNNLYNHHFIAV